jgi:hypothetical protein
MKPTQLPATSGEKVKIPTLFRKERERRMGHPVYLLAGGMIPFIRRYSTIWP